MIQWLTAATAVLVLGAPALRAQECDDSDPCTVNDACGVDGMCQGTFQTGAACNDFMDCTVNDRCQNNAQIGMPGCKGDPAPIDSACGTGCGTCQELFPGSGVIQCMGQASDNGKACDPGIGGPCIEGHCSVNSAGGFNLAFCNPTVKVCPDTDGNPCTDNCNFTNGACEKNAPKCDDVCATCNPTTGMCETKNVGGGCNDFNPCTSASSCQTIAGVPFAVCLVGASTQGSPTPTATSPGSSPTVPPASTATSTRTTGVPPTPAACVGDCNDNKIVAVNEVITGVNIALGSAPISQCSGFDTNGNQMVDINELIAGVASLLNGCV